MVASLHRRDTVSFVKAGTEANIIALLLLTRLTSSVPTDHTGAAGCMTALASPDGWVHFQINFHEKIQTGTNLLPLQSQYTTDRIKKVPICLPANPMQRTPELSLTFSFHTQTSLGIKTTEMYSLFISRWIKTMGCKLKKKTPPHPTSFQCLDMDFQHEIKRDHAITAHSGLGSGPGTAPTQPGTAWDEHPANSSCKTGTARVKRRLSTARAGSAKGMYNIGNTSLWIPG